MIVRVASVGRLGLRRGVASDDLLDVLVGHRLHPHRRLLVDGERTGTTSGSAVEVVTTDALRREASVSQNMGGSSTMPKVNDSDVNKTYWHDRLDRIEMDCRASDWDSYHAKPVTEAAIRLAKSLCYSLDVVPTNTGGIEVSLASEAVCIEIASDGSLANTCVYHDDLRAWLLNQMTVTNDPTSWHGGHWAPGPPDLTWVERTQTVNAIDPAVKAIEENPGWRLIATGLGTSGQTMLTFGWPWPEVNNSKL
jgi:hypothetical protein